jgi:hypothetical protein
MSHLHLTLTFFSACCCSCRWRETTSLNCGHQLAYCSSPWWYMGMECHDSNDTVRGKPNNSEKNLSQCQFVHHKSRMEWTGREPGSPCWVAGDCPLSHDMAFVFHLLFVFWFRSKITLHASTRHVANMGLSKSRLGITGNIHVCNTSDLSGMLALVKISYVKRTCHTYQLASKQYYLPTPSEARRTHL